MSKCKLSSVDYIHSVFSPAVAIMTSSDADCVCMKNNLTFSEMLKPFSKLSQDISIKDTSNISHVVKNLQINFQDVNIPIPPPNYIKKLLNDVVQNCSNEGNLTLVTVGNYDVQLATSTPWFEAYRDVFLKTLQPSDHELLNHCLGVVFVVSTSNSDPLDQFSKFTQQQNYQQHQQPSKTPKWFSANVLKFYVLLHDVCTGDQTRADNIYQSMKMTYGATSCYILPINSQINQPNFKSGQMSDLPDPWLQYLIPTGCSLPPPDSTQPTAPQHYQNEESYNSQNEESSDTLFNSHPLAASPSMNDGMLDNASSTNPSSTSYAMRSSASLPQLPFQNGSFNLSTVKLPFSNTTLHLPHGQCLTLPDQERIRAFIVEFTVRALIPWVEKTMKSLNDQIAPKMRLSRSLFRKFLPGGGSGTSSSSRSSASSGLGSQSVNSTSSNLSSGGLSNSLSNLSSGGGTTSVVYTQDAIELQMRRYADLAFLFQQYEIAYQTYNELKKDFKNEMAWFHYAGALEMSALAVFLQGSNSQRQYPHHNMEQAIHYYLNICRNHAYATRAALMNSEALKSKGMYSEASLYFLKLTTEDNDLRSALLLEQTAHCYVNMRVPMVRKFAFHQVLAGHRFSKAGQRKHAVRCYTQALQIFKGREWSLAEDHINFTIGRQSFYLRQPDVAAAALQHLLCKKSQQSPSQQAVFLKEFIFVFKQHLTSLIGEKTLLDGAFPQLPLPIITTNQIKVMLGRPTKQIEDDDKDLDICVEARGIQFADSDASNDSWLQLEESLVEYANDGFLLPNYRPTISCFTKDTNNKCHPMSPVAEPVTVQIPLENPIQVPLVLMDLYLLWRFVPNGQDSMSHKVITNEMEKDRLQQAKEVVTTEVLKDFYLLPGERKPVELSVTPKQLGQLHIIGMAFHLATASPNQNTEPDSSAISISAGDPGNLLLMSANANAVVVKGKLPLEVEGRWNVKTNSYDDDRRLDLMITNSMPLLKVVFSELPSTLACGEVRRLNLEISNVGQQPLTKLLLATAQPGFLTFGFDEFADTFESTVYQTICANHSKSNNSSTNKESGECLYHCQDLTSQEECVPVPLVSPGVLSPGQTVTLPCWIRGGNKPAPNTPIDMLFYYRSTENNPHIPHRVLRHRFLIDLVPSLKLRAQAQRSLGNNSANLLLNLEIENASLVDDQASTEFSVLQISSASKNWTIKHLTTNKTSDIGINPREVVCLCLRGEQSRVSPGHTLFSNLVFNQQEIHSAGTPCADFYYRSNSSSPDPAPHSTQSEEAPVSAEQGDSANRVKLTLIVIWKMHQIRNDASVVTATGQTHVVLHMLDQWIEEPPETKNMVSRAPVRFIPTVEADPNLKLNPLLLQSKMVRMNLKHPHMLKHNFSRQRLAKISVEVILYNAGDHPVVVRVEPVESDSNIRTSGVVSQSPLLNPGGPVEAAESALNSLSVVPLIAWVCLTKQQTRLNQRESVSLLLTACLPRPGVYEMHSLNVKAALIKFSEDSAVNPTDLVFVKQINTFSSLITIEEDVN